MDKALKIIVIVVTVLKAVIEILESCRESKA